MPGFPTPLLIALALALPGVAQSATDGKQTVCTITVNSANEKDAFRRHLPEAEYVFLELIERGRPDWLVASCQSDVACDLLIISGHYDGGTVFFSDRLDAPEHLPLAELERASCSGSCPALFSRLREVYLFGCNTLNPRPQSSATAEIVRSLVREGHSPAAARRQLQSLSAAHGESSLDRMRHIFKGVPEIYGFTSTAPLGPLAGATLDRYFASCGTSEIATCRRGDQLLGYFEPHGMAMASGTEEGGPHAQARSDMCQFADERLSTSNRLAFVHELLQRHVGEARLYLDRILRLLASIDERERETPVVARALQDIARDLAARERFLQYTRETQEPAVRMRLLEAAHGLGWLTQDERWQALALMLAALHARARIGLAEVDLACGLNEQQDLDGAFDRRVTPGSGDDSLPRAAMRACLGSAEDRKRTLQGLVSADERDVLIAQTYLRHRPVTDASELRSLAEGIGRMDAGDAQIRALETLARHYVSDPGVLELLTGLYARTPSFEVQEAIAGILIRADLRPVASDPLVHLLRAQRRRPRAAGGGDDIIDALIHMLQRR